MFKKDNLQLIGSLIKTHGVNGALILKLESLKSEDIPDIESVFVYINGLLVPFFISELLDRDQSSMIVKFDDIDSKDKATEYAGCEIYIAPDIINLPDDSHSGFPDITGFNISDEKHGDIGLITGIMSIRNNPLLKVKSGNNEYLIPYHKDFIQDTDIENKTVYTNLPEGLLDL